MSLSTAKWVELPTRAPQFPFVPRDFGRDVAYRSGFGVAELMPLNGNGIVTKRDRMNIQDSADGVHRLVADIVSLDEATFRRRYQLPSDVRDWRYEWARADAFANAARVPFAEIGYRLFDPKFIYYSGRSRGMVGWPVSQVMMHYLRGHNIGLLTAKAHRDAAFAHVFITQRPTEAIHFSATTGSNAMNFPLYLYPDESDLDQPDVSILMRSSIGKFVISLATQLMGNPTKSPCSTTFMACCTVQPIARSMPSS